MKKFVILFLLIMIGLGSAYSVKRYNKYYVPLTDQAGTLVTDFTLPALTQKERKLSDFKGKIVLLNFWASWCPPCRKEIPDFIKVQNKFKDKGFTIFGVSIEHREPTEKYAKDAGINFPIVYGEQAGLAIGEKYGMIGIPYSILLDKNQKIIAIYPSYQTLTEERLSKDIEKHL